MGLPAACRLLAVSGAHLLSVDGLVGRCIKLHHHVKSAVSICLKFIITRDSEVIMFSPCVFVCLCVCGCLCLSRCLSRRFNYEGLVPHKQYFAGTLLGMPSCASYVSRTHDVIDDVTKSQSRSNLKLIYLRQY